MNLCCSSATVQNFLLLRGRVNHPSHQVLMDAHGFRVLKPMTLGLWLLALTGRGIFQQHTTPRARVCPGICHDSWARRSLPSLTRIRVGRQHFAYNDDTVIVTTVACGMRASVPGDLFMKWGFNGSEHNCFDNIDICGGRCSIQEDQGSELERERRKSMHSWDRQVNVLHPKNGSDKMLLQKADSDPKIVYNEVEELKSQGAQDEVVISTSRFKRARTTVGNAREGRDLLLFISEADGINLESNENFGFLSTSFDAWYMAVDDEDRSTFQQLTDRVAKFLQTVGVNDERQAVLVGSSFGGLLAANVAHQREAWIRGLVLVNPATSYARSTWRIIASFAANAPGPKAFGTTVARALAIGLPAAAMMPEYTREFEALPLQEVPAWLMDLTQEWLGHSSRLFGGGSQEQVRWRLKHWMEAGSSQVDSFLQDIELPVLVLAGSEDNMFPSVQEAARLSRLIPTCQQVVLSGVGHAALHSHCEANLSALIRSSIIYDRGLLDQVAQRKKAKKSPKRWQQEGGSITKNMLEMRLPETLKKPGADPILDFNLDMDDDVVKLVWTGTNMMNRFMSPVFLSVNDRGEVKEGLGGVPDYEEGRSILFVGNHQLMGIDMPILVQKIFKDKGIFVRGLTHPMVGVAGVEKVINRMKNKQLSTARRTNGSGRALVGVTRRVASSTAKVFGVALGSVGNAGVSATNKVVRASKRTIPIALSLLRGDIGTGARDDRAPRGGAHGYGSFSILHERAVEIMAKLGAVPVSPRNMMKLLKAGKAVLLYPGGVKEALHQKGQEYRMFWPEKSEFVRMAASCNATIVPVAAIGSADSAEIFMDVEDIFQLPFGVGESVQDAADIMPRARQGDEREYFLPPLLIPKVPARHYFIFGRPIDTTLVDERDRDTCRRVYDLTRSTVSEGIEYLLQARQNDPYGISTKRLLYETVIRTQAPFFPVDAVAFNTSKKES